MRGNRRQRKKKIITNIKHTITKLSPNEGDLIVLRFDEHVDYSEMMNVATQVHNHLKYNTLIVMPKYVDILNMSQDEFDSVINQILEQRKQLCIDNQNIHMEGAENTETKID